MYVCEQIWKGGLGECQSSGRVRKTAGSKCHKETLRKDDSKEGKAENHVKSGEGTARREILREKREERKRGMTEQSNSNGKNNEGGTGRGKINEIKELDEQLEER